MKRCILILAGCLFVVGAIADTTVVNVIATGANAISEPIRASGWLDRIEISRADPGGQDVVGVTIATYEGNTAINTFATVAALATNGVTVIRPRVIGTTTAGVNLAAATGATGTGTNVTQFLTAAYEPMLLGHNMRMAVTASAGTNANVRAVLYYTRDRR